jgi:hypothetical protein
MEGLIAWSGDIDRMADERSPFRHRLHTSGLFRLFQLMKKYLLVFAISAR